MGEHKLVPAEPTVDMILKLMAVGLRHAEYTDGGSPTVLDVAYGYKAMLAAAPIIEQEPVAWIINHSDWAGSDPISEKAIAERYEADQPGCTVPLYLRPQSAPETAKLVEALQSLLDMQDEDCRYDHQGYCQNHNLDHVDEGCRVAKARYTLMVHQKGGDV